MAAGMMRARSGGSGPAAFLRIFFAPASQLRETRSEPEIWSPFTTGCLVSIASELTLGTIGASRAAFASVDDHTVLFWVSVIGWLVLTPAYSMLIASLVCRACCRLGRTSATYEEVFSMNAHIYVVWAVGHFASALLWRFSSHDALTAPSVLEALPAESAVLKLVAVFHMGIGFWYAALLGLGLRIVGRVPLWVAYAVPLALLVMKGAAFWFSSHH